MPQQAVSAEIIPNSGVEIFSLKTEGTKTKAARVPIRWLARKFRSLHFETERKLSKIINDYLYLPFSLLIILCCTSTINPCSEGLTGKIREFQLYSTVQVDSADNLKYYLY